MKTYQDGPDETQENTFKEYSTRDLPVVKTFSERYGFDERDGPSEELDYREDRIKRWRAVRIFIDVVQYLDEQRVCSIG